MRAVTPSLLSLVLLMVTGTVPARALSEVERQAAFFELIDFNNGALLERNPGLVAARDALLLAAPDYAAAEAALMTSIPVAHYSCGPSRIPSETTAFAVEFFRRINLATPGLENVKAAVEAGDWSSALAAWRDYTVDKLRALALPSLYQQSYKTHPRQTSIASLLLGELSYEDYLAGVPARGGIDFYEIYGLRSHPDTPIDWLAQPPTADTTEDAKYSYANFSFAGSLVFRYHTGPVIAGAQGNSLTLSGSGNSVVAVFANAHGLSNGELIQIAGADPAAYNGLYRVTVIDPHRVSYTTASAVTSSPAVGSGRRATRTRETAALQKWFSLAADFASRQKNMVSPLNLSTNTANRALYRTVWQGADWGATSASALSQGDRATEMLAAAAIYCKLLPENSSRQVDWNAAPSQSATASLAEGATSLIPAEDLARIVFSLMADTPEALILRYFQIGAVPNQRINGLHALYLLANVFDEFKAAPGLLSHTDQALGRFADEMFYPDGAMLERSPNYNEGDALQIREIAAMASAGSTGAGITRLSGKIQAYEKSTAWMANPLGTLPRMATYAAPAYPELWRGGSIIDAWRNGTVLRTSYLSTTNAASLAVWRGLLDSSQPVPGTTSSALPYAGYYMMRNGWGSRAHYLFFANTPPGRGHRQLDQNGIQIAAFGRELLTVAGPPPYDATFVDSSQSADFNGFASFLGEASTFKCNTVAVDGRSQNEGNTTNNVAVTTTRANPWLTTRDFDFVEGNYTAGYGGTNVYNPLLTTGDNGAALNDTAHRRSIVFVKQAGLWLVTDRMSTTATQPRRYRQIWNFPTRKDPGQPIGPTNLTGFLPDEIRTDEPSRVIRTSNPGGPNVSLHHLGPSAVAYETFTASRSPYLGWYGAGLSGVRVPSKNVHAVFEGPGEQLLATVILPSDTGQFRVGPQTNGPLSGPSTADASMALPDQSNLRFVAARDSATLRLGHADVIAQTFVTVSRPGEPVHGLVAGASDVLPVEAPGRFFATESFRYASGTRLSSTASSATEGWITGWKPTANLSNSLSDSYTVASGALTNSTNRMTMSPGNHLSLRRNGPSLNSEILMYRQLAVPVDLSADHDYFVSFVLAMPSDTSTSSSAQGRLELLADGQTNASTFFGAGAIDATTKEMRIRGRLLGADFVTDQVAELGQTYLIVARLRGSASGPRQMWIRSFGPGQSPSAPADWGPPDVSTTATPLSLSVLGCRATFYTRQPVAVDEIRLGETWAEAIGATTFTFTAAPGNLRAVDAAGLPAEATWQTATSNTPPIIRPPTDQSTVAGTDSPTWDFSIDDAETAASLLQVTVQSSDPVIVPDGSITLGGTSEVRTISIAPPVGANGTANIALTVSDGALTSTSSFQVTVRNENDLDSWRRTHFGPDWINLPAAELAADPDEDGSPNLLEYATGMDPQTPDRLPLTYTLRDGEFIITYRRAKRAAGVHMTPMISSDLSHWHSEGLSAPVILPNAAEDAEQDLVEVRAPVSAGSLFARIVASTYHD
jgi:hypothetical protein